MRPISILVLTLAASALFLPAAAGASPCLPSAEAVRQAHPGVHTHADWHFIDNRKCWMNRGEWDGRHQSVRSDQPRPVADNRGARVRAVQQTREVIAPTKVKTVAAPAPPETTGFAAARPMPSSWTDEFDPLLQGREERAQLIPAVLTITEAKPIAATMVPHGPRWMTAWDWMIVALWALFLFGSVTGVPFLVGDAWKWLRTREARR